MTLKSIIAPSLLSCDLANLNKDAQEMLDMYVHDFFRQCFVATGVTWPAKKENSYLSLFCKFYF